MVSLVTTSKAALIVKISGIAVGLITIMMEIWHEFLISSPEVGTSLGGFAHGDDLSGDLVASTLFGQTDTLFSLTFFRRTICSTVVPGIVSCILSLVDFETAMASPAVKAISSWSISVVVCEFSNVIVGIATWAVATVAIVGKSVVVAHKATVAEKKTRLKNAEI